MDGYRERVVIDIHLPDGQGVVTVLVTDLHGYRVKSIADRAIGSPDETLFWDATDDHGHLVSPGMYVIHIRIYNGKKEKVIREVVAVTYR
jgi:flagellar hook assembly protein FlgD